MGTGKGVLQGYTGAAAVDARHQIIVEAQAHGTGSEQEVLLPVVDALRGNALLDATTLVTADAGYHSEANLAGLATRGVDALIADAELRQRDERFATQASHRAKPDPLHDKSAPAEARTVPLYRPSDFTYDPSGADVCVSGGKVALSHGAKQHDARVRGRTLSRCETRLCPVRAPRAVSSASGADADAPGRLFPRWAGSGTEAVHGADESADRHGRGTGALRGPLGTVEPVFANVCYNKAAGAVHAARSAQGRWAMEALLPRAQHREARAARVRRGVRRRWAGSRDASPAEHRHE